MKLSALLLCVTCLGQLVYAADTEWVAVLHSNPVPHSASRRHKLVLEDMGAVHLETINLGSLLSYVFSGPEDAAERIAQHPDVDYVHPNYNVSTLGVTKQITPFWNLGEMSQANGSAEYPFEYLFDDSAGNGTVVYIVDSGIDITNGEFGGRAEWGVTHLGGRNVPHHQVDDRGHGTIVAGIVGSRCCGVAKKARLVAVKIIDYRGWGKISDVGWAIKWATEDAKKRGALGRAIINVSLWSKRMPGARRDINMDIIAAVAKMGMFVVTAAGNHNMDALKATPGAAPAACNVGAYTTHGERADFSNYGPGVDIWAPGVNIWAPESSQTEKKTSDRPSIARYDGTSYAAPHVAGVAAYLMGLETTKFDAAHPDAIDWCDRMRKMGKYAISPGGAKPRLYNGVHNHH